MAINGVSSELMPVTGGVPQGSVLGLVLFVIYINGTDLELNNSLSIFADDTKIGNGALTEYGRWGLQDLLKLSIWSEKWKIPCNINKCQILQTGSKTRKIDCDGCGVMIKRVQSVKDLGVTVSSRLKSP